MKLLVWEVEQVGYSLAGVFQVQHVAFAGVLAGGLYEVDVL